MSTPTVFVVKNQAGLFLNKQLEWIDGNDGQPLYRTAHRDEAINTVFEVSAKDIYLRAEAIACPVDAKSQPAVRELASKTDLLSAEPVAAEAPADAESVEEPALNDAAPTADDTTDTTETSSPH